MDASLAQLDAEAIIGALPSPARGMLGSLRVLDSVDSTNDALLRERDPLQNSVLLANRQTAGRGRRGRVWQSPPDANLYLSVYRRFDPPMSALGGLSLAVGVALVQALSGLGVSGLGLKWPNDLLRDGRKLGGILIESAGRSLGPARAVIGIGLNVRMPAAITGIDQPWADLSGQLPAPLDRNRLAAALLAELLQALARFSESGLSPFLGCWRKHDALAGRPVRVIDGDRESPGVALGVADDGALLVEHAAGVRRHYSGEVSLRLAVESAR